MNRDTNNPSLLQPEERVLATLERDGSRRWLHPKLAHGRFLLSRRIVAYVLIAIFTITPYVNINGKPAILLDILRRRFTLFGFTFLPTDTPLLALLVVSSILLIFFFTALLGRVWCGWACPQTVYMEFVFRPIERLFVGRAGVGGAPKGHVAGWRQGLRLVIYAAVSFYLAHTFLAYFVGVDHLRRWVTQSPTHHPLPFSVVMFVTLAMLFNFTYFREQTCTIACPYGRFQSVLLDKRSLIISYDAKRGEPRGKMKKVALPVVEGAAAAPAQGDCIDCDMCASVCPTGIDIRQGLQLECIGCAQCIDACDAVMKKIDRTIGLIRYTSQAAMAGQPHRILRPRVLIYPILAGVLLTALVVLLITKAPFDVTLLRGLGAPFNVTPSGAIENTMRVKVTNRTDKPLSVTFDVADNSNVKVIATTGSTIQLAPGQVWTEPVEVIAPAKAFTFGALDVMLRVNGSDGVHVERRCRLMGPSVQPAIGPASFPGR